MCSQKKEYLGHNGMPNIRLILNASFIFGMSLNDDLLISLIDWGLISDLCRFEIPEFDRCECNS